MACEKKSTQNHKPPTFSRTEIDAAMQLIQLSNSIVDSSTTYLDEDHHSSNNSYSVQWKREQSKGDTTSAHTSPSTTEAVEDILADIEEDECFKRRNKRYRYVHEIYQVTHPVKATHIKSH
ncbi:hypothetical protein RJT34_13354 [Clitoria ternatea]|uniref:Uncharacterized protein n=1 Tax=Clitoria ternatea TaxID=43366 RepID=A0AAN9PLQ9_CLITE